MNKTLPLLGAGVLLGIIATLAITQASRTLAPSSGQVVRDIVDIPQMTETVAEQHRAEQYTGLDTIQEILALPTEFARSEALHVLAGRSAPGTVRNLVLEANRIADEMEREAVLIVLFSRLTELDPQAALLLSRDERFAGLASLEDTVWRVWARNDLDDALFAARTQTRFAEQRGAARSLYQAFGYLGNETTARIETELGIEPDRATRARYLYRLADQSPAEAITYINGLARDEERREAISWLAYYLSLGDPNEALRYADLFENAMEGARFTSILEGDILRSEPASAIEEMLAGSVDNRMWGQVQQAVVELASTDLDAVLGYYEQARSEQHRHILGAAIVTELAKRDPSAALAWARANDRGRMPVLAMSALQEIAKSDPQRALDEALAMSNFQTRSMLVGNVVQQAAMSDPTVAVALLEQIDDEEQRLAISQGLVQTWVQTDADAALEWILGQDKESSERLMMQAVNGLVHSDVDAAIRLLPKLGDRQQADARRRIVETLSRTRSIDEVQAFVLQYQGQPDYDQLQATAASAVAQYDTALARQLASQIQDRAVRDSAYMQIITQQADWNAAEALGWLEGVADETTRSRAVAQVAVGWYRQDPAAATQWIATMPQGAGRDGAILQLAGAWAEPTAQQTALIDGIGDPEIRSQAKLRQIYAVMRTDPDKARAMLDDEDISDQQRAEVEQMMSRSGLRF